jgi:hypothetical protein
MCSCQAQTIANHCKSDDRLAALCVPLRKAQGEGCISRILVMLGAEQDPMTLGFEKFPDDGKQLPIYIRCLSSLAMMLSESPIQAWYSPCAIVVQ